MEDQDAYGKALQEKAGNVGYRARKLDQLSKSTHIVWLNNMILKLIKLVRVTALIKKEYCCFLT